MFDSLRLHGLKGERETFFTSCCLLTQSCLTLCDPMNWSAKLLCSRDSPGKDTGGGCHSHHQGIFQIQKLNLGLLHYRQIPYHLSPQESPYMVYPTIKNRMKFSKMRLIRIQLTLHPKDWWSWNLSDSLAETSGSMKPRWYSYLFGTELILFQTALWISNGPCSKKIIM